jgi:hypothetical protein
MRSVWTLSLLALILLCGTVLSAQSTANCTYSRFVYPGTETILTWAGGLNKWGSIVGTAQKQSAGPSGVIGYIRYTDGSFKSYQVNGHPTQFYHRNDNGDTVGFYIDSNDRKRGLLLSGSNKQTTVDYPGAKGTVLTGINKFGTIVGYYTDSSGHFKGFKRWSSGAFQPVTIPNYTDLRPMDINDSGVISGATGQGGPIHVHGFWLFGSTWQIVDDPDYPAGSTELLGMNNRGEYVGNAYDSNGTAHPILLVGNSSFFDLDVPNAVEASAGDISDSNIIVGGATFKGSEEAFVAHCQ